MFSLSLSFFFRNLKKIKKVIFIGFQQKPLLWLLKRTCNGFYIYLNKFGRKTHSTNFWSHQKVTTQSNIWIWVWIYFILYCAKVLIFVKLINGCFVWHFLQMKQWSYWSHFLAIIERYETIPKWLVQRFLCLSHKPIQIQYFKTEKCL